MTRLTIIATMFLTLSAAPAAAANCFWCKGIYKCYHRSSHASVVRPQGDPSRQYRPSESYTPPRACVPNEGSGMESFTYGCTLIRC